MCFRLVWIFAIFLFFHYNSRAATITSVCNGYWNDPNTWNNGVPGTYDIVVINHYVGLNVNVTLIAPGKLIINNSGTLCGHNNFTGAFTTYGPMKVGTLNITGNSVNYDIIMTSGNVIGSGGTWAVNGNVTIGANFTCSTPIPCVPPNASFNLIDYTVCSGSSVSILNTTTYGVSYLWQTPGSTYPTATNAFPILNYSQPGNYTITLIVVNPYGSDTAYQNIVVLPKPAISSMNDTSVCYGDPVYLYVNGNGSPNWTPGNVLSCDTCYMTWWNASSTTSFIASITDSNSCKNYDTILVNVSVPLSGLDSNYYFCSNDSLEIMLNMVSGQSYLWSDGTSFTSHWFYTEQTIFVTATDTNGCQKTDTTELFQWDLPDISLNNGLVLCQGETLEIYNSLGLPGQSHLWNSNSTEDTLVIDSGGTYTLEITDSNGCKNYDTSIIVSHMLPFVNLQEDTIPCNQNSVESANLNFSSSYANLWSTGENSSAIQIYSEGFYWLEVTDSLGCRNSDTVYIFKESCSCSDQHLPSAFSPNNDGNNDLLFLQGDDFELINWEIYNRFGELIFHTDDRSMEWDGTQKSQKLNAGVYVYWLKAKCKYSGENFLEKGNITLVR